MSDNPAADKDWEEAEFRAQVLAKLPDQLSPGTVEWTMGHLEISRATLFRPLKQFRADGRTRALFRYAWAQTRDAADGPWRRGDRVRSLQGLLRHPP